MHFRRGARIYSILSWPMLKFSCPGLPLVTLSPKFDFSNFRYHRLYRPCHHQTGAVWPLIQRRLCRRQPQCQGYVGQPRRTSIHQLRFKIGPFKQSCKDLHQFLPMEQRLNCLPSHRTQGENSARGCRCAWATAFLLQLVCHRSYLGA